IRLSLCALGLLAAACGVPGFTEDDLQGLTGRGALSGLVVDADTGAPLAGATVQVRGTSTLSGPEGSYRLGSLAVGEADGSATRQGYQTAYFHLRLKGGGNLQDVPLIHIPCTTSGCATDEYCRAATLRCESGAGVAEASGT